MALVIGGHIVLDLQMALKHKNNHCNETIVFKLGENEVLHKIPGLLFQKITRLHKSRSSREELEFDLSNFV